MVDGVRKRGRPTQDQDKLSQDGFLDCAQSLLRSDGKVPSLRKIAGELGVDPMAIYHYFPSKSALLEALAVRLMEGIYMPNPAGVWEEELKALCRSYLTLLSSHPGLLEIMLGMSSAGPAEVFMAKIDRIMAGLSLTQQDREHGLHLLVDYLHGFALAMQCAPKGKALTVDMLEGPLKFYVSALKSEQA